MKRKIMKHRMGEDSIWSACLEERETALLVGDFKTDEKYRIGIAGMGSSVEILWEKSHELECQCEANAILREREGYLIGGNACGVPTKEGGRGWKAYVFRTDERGNTAMERTYELGENDAVYSMERRGAGFLFAGETEKQGMKYVFLMKTDGGLNPMETEYFGPHENVLVGGISGNALAYSFLHEGKWLGRVIEFGENLEEGEIVAELDGVQIYSIDSFDGALFICGEIDGNAYAAKLSGGGDIIEDIMDTGVITAVKASRDGVVLVGDLEAVPYVAVRDMDMNVVEEHAESEVAGWLEDVCTLGRERILAVGYSMKDMEAVAMLFERDGFDKMPP